MDFYSVLPPFQDYFSSYETGQSVGGAKTGGLRKKNTWNTRKQNLVCALKCDALSVLQQPLAHVHAHIYI